MKKTNTKRLISCIVAVMLMLTMLVVPVSATETETTETLPVYQSSTKFSTESGDGTWDNGVWAAQTLDPATNVYTNMQYVVNGQYRSTDGNNDHFVSGDRISPPTNGKWSTESLRTHWAARTFIAPHTGSVTVTCVEDRITPDEGSHPNVRIRFESDGSFTELLPETMLSDPMVNTAQGTYNLTLKKGDKIHFEIVRTKEYFVESADGAISYKSYYPNVYWDPIITYTKVIPQPEERDSFQSSEYFDTVSEDGTWDSGVWSANVFDATTEEYSAMTKLDDNGRWAGNSGEYVDADEIAPVTGSDVSGTFERYGGVKTFTAPKTGIIELSYAEITHASDSTLVHGVMAYAWNQGLKFRVRHETVDGVSTIYPTNGDYLEKEKNASQYMIEANTVTNTVEIKQGDKLHFEVMRLVKDQAWQGVYCDPIIKYTKVIPQAEERDSFKSSEYFNTSSGDGTWDFGIWSAQTLDPTTDVYTNMQYVVDGVYRPSSGVNDHFVSGDRISPPVNGQWSTEDLRTHWAARTFAAPKDGVVTVTCVEDRITPDEGSHPKVRIRFESDGSFTELLPETMLSDPKVNTAQGTYNLTLKKGDKIHFEIVRTKEYFVESADGSISYKSYYPNVYWDPIITYSDDILIDKENITFKAGETTVTEFTNIAGAASLTATVPVVSNNAIDSGVVIVAIYDGSGKLARVATSTAGERTGITTNYSLTFGDTASTIEKGSIKVYLWDGLDTLNPLTDAVLHMQLQ